MYNIMPWKVVKSGKKYRVKNLTTGKLSKNTFKLRANADIQVKNRYRFQNSIKVKN